MIDERGRVRLPRVSGERSSDAPENRERRIAGDGARSEGNGAVQSS